MTTQTTPEQAREIAQHLFLPNGDNGYALRSLAEQVETLTAERDAYIVEAARVDTGWRKANEVALETNLKNAALKDAARLALDALVDLKGIRMNEVEHLSVLRATNALKAVL